MTIAATEPTPRKSRAIRDTQRATASRRKRDTRSPHASQNQSDTRTTNASLPTSDHRTRGASHTVKDDRQAEASREEKDTQHVVASRTAKDPQRSAASRDRRDTQEEEASQAGADTRTTGAGRKPKLKNAVRFFYDLQKLRIQSGNRAGRQADHAVADLDEHDKKFLEKTSDGLEGLEKEALKEVRRLLRGIPIFDEWLEEQKGVGPTMAGVLVAEFNIEMCGTPSKMWAWAGLSVVDGHAQRRVKGQKAGFNPWLKSKIVKVLADCLLRANSPWRSFYDNYKNRKQNTILDVCMCCNGSGRMKVEEDPLEAGQPIKDGEPLHDGHPIDRSEPGMEGQPTDVGEPKKKQKTAKCANCKGTGGPAPWGRSDAHRHQASMRYMVKMFLLEFWKRWRTIEGLEVRPSYAEEYLHRPHHK